MREREWDLDAPERRVLEWCQRSEASCIRLSPVFGRHAERGESLHYMYDGHWNAAGHALAARTVAENLGETGLLNTGRGNR